MFDILKIVSRVIFVVLLAWLILSVVFYANSIYVSRLYPMFDVMIGRYHTTSQIDAIVKQKDMLNPFYHAYSIEDVLTGFGPIEDPSKFDINVMIVCGQHGREVVSSELCLTLVKLIKLTVRDTVLTEMIQKITLSKIGLWVVPVANPWARIHVETTPDGGCRRTNANHVDLNRNYPTSLEHKIKSRRLNYNSSNPEEDSPGPRALSETEAQAMDSFLNFVKPNVLLNVHSGGNDILIPFDGSDINLPPHYRTMVQIANYARENSCVECRVGNSALLYYTSIGTMVDYAIEEYGTQIAYTFEIYQSKELSKIDPRIPLTSDQCREFFNPPESELTVVLKKWATIILRVIEGVDLKRKKK